jgi:hypothetical protein
MTTTIVRALINTQLQLGEDRSTRGTNRFNGLSAWPSPKPPAPGGESTQPARNLDYCSTPPTEL